MHPRAHGCPPDSEENIGRTTSVLYGDYPYAGVTSSGIWLLVAGVVTTRVCAHFVLPGGSRLCGFALKSAASV